MKRIALCFAAALSAAAAAPRELPLAAAPPPIQQAVRGEPGLAGMKVDALEVEERDLNHDGQAEWLVVANATDEAGFHVVNRPVWLFQKEGGTFRQVGFLGYQLKVEPGRGSAGGWDELRTVAKDGARQRCTLFGWERDRYQRRGCCHLKTGAAQACP